MTDWRYWITYSGKVQADTEAQAEVAAWDEHAESLHTGSRTPMLEVEEDLPPRTFAENMKIIVDAAARLDEGRGDAGE